MTKEGVGKAGMALAVLQVRAQQLNDLISGVKDAEDAASPSVLDVVRTSVHALNEEYFTYAHACWLASLTEPGEGE